ncbi:pyruvate dehydrogenase (acetyl-transferring) E1 component subunit alpha [Candidatus Pacearchaeota archaeon]|nr:pyruvate dehydrogenase (acetyl-transferring) E1 component subunit alpha [Candidatus Pacearchaeota archaeon]
MMEKTIAKFDVLYLQILDENGDCDEKNKPKITDEVLKEMYRFLILTRAFDDKALKLQRQGRLGTYAPMRGQEAGQIGSAFALSKDDWVFPAFRENGVYMIKGVSADMLFRYWAGDERGMQIPKGINILPVSITVGGHLPHAVGTAMGFNYLKQKNVSVVYFGDGATSEGDFHEALNFAGVFKAPCVFICQNNQWAISLPVREQTASQTIAQKAIAYGIPGIQVDGNDVFAVYKATMDAVTRARKGLGATLIECLTYRLADHTTSDDAKKYRPEEEVRSWENKDPILRFEKYLTQKKIINPVIIGQVKAEAEQQIEKAVKIAESVKPQLPTEMFDYLYSDMTDEMKEQREQSKRENNISKGASVSEHSAKNAGVVGELEEV